MKKLFKIFLVTIIINLIVYTGLTTWLGVSSIIPSFEKADISLVDLLKKDIDPVKKVEIEQSVNEKSKEIGKQAAEKIISGLKVITPNVKINLAKMPKIPYPYPSTNEVVENNNEAANRAAKSGLKILQDSVKQSEAIKKQALADMSSK